MEQAIPLTKYGVSMLTVIGIIPARAPGRSPVAGEFLPRFGVFDGPVIITHTVVHLPPPRLPELKGKETRGQLRVVDVKLLLLLLAWTACSAQDFLC